MDAIARGLGFFGKEKLTFYGEKHGEVPECVSASFSRG